MAAWTCVAWGASRAFVAEVVVVAKYVLVLPSQLVVEVVSGGFERPEEVVGACQEVAGTAAQVVVAFQLGTLPDQAAEADQATLAEGLA